MPLTVLVVDDEPLARDGMKLLLSHQARVESVLSARNGREAIAMIQDRKPDLVLLDVQMPRIDGFAVIHAIGAERMPPVIFVTAHDQYAIRAFEIAAVDYLLKPIQPERLAQTVARVQGRLASVGAGGGVDQAALSAMLERITAALPGKLVGGVSGFAVASFGYAAFFAFTAAVGIPVVLLCLWIGRVSSPDATEDEADARPPVEALAARAGSA